MTEFNVDGMKAFIKAKSEMKSPNFNKKNPHFKNNYADLEEIRRVTKKPLADNDINLLQRFDVVDGVFMLVTNVIYKGEFVLLTSKYLLSSTLSPQQLGSAITYAKRYERGTICGLLADEDDDAEVAEKPSQKTMINKNQIIELQELIEKTDSDIILFNNHMGVKSLTELDSDGYKKALHALNQKANK
jgi:hypothetical protein